MIRYLYARLLKKMRGTAIRNSRVPKTSKIEAGSQFVNSSMDRYSYCGYDCEIINTEIGSFCSIANNVIIGGAMHTMSWASTSPVFCKGRDSVTKKFSEFSRPNDKRTIICNDVWIGERAMIKQGVTVGNGAVIGMGAIVTKDIPPYAIVAGNPAKIIRYRFDEKVCNALNESNWWLLDDDSLKKCANQVTVPEIFVQKVMDIQKQTTWSTSK